MYFLDFEDFQIAGASPEPLVKVTGRRVETRPIAGTRPRGGDAGGGPCAIAERAARRREGARRARDARRPRPQRPRPGLRVRHASTVDELMAVETYSHVMHIVSSGLGHAARRRSAAMDALRAVLPAGHALGRAEGPRDADHRRARAASSAAPTAARSATSSYTGDLDTCIHIRTVVVKDGVAHVQAGGGTVADAEPDYEYRGVASPRRRRVFEAIELAVRAAGLGHEHARPRHRQLRLVHLQPRPVPGRAGRRARGRAQRRARRSTSCSRAAPDRSSSRPGPCTPGRGRHLDRGRRARFPEAGIPTLGVCLGHQALAEAFGGRVVRGEPVHGKDAEVEHDGADDLRRPAEARSTAGRYHSLVVDPDLPGRARADRRRCGDVVMGVRHRELPAEGVQFHPESVLTPDGKRLLAQLPRRASS